MSSELDFATAWDALRHPALSNRQFWHVWERALAESDRGDVFAAAGARARDESYEPRSTFSLLRARPRGARRLEIASIDDAFVFHAAVASCLRPLARPELAVAWNATALWARDFKRRIRPALADAMHLVYLDVEKFQTSFLHDALDAQLREDGAPDDARRLVGRYLRAWSPSGRGYPLWGSASFALATYIVNGAARALERPPRKAFAVGDDLVVVTRSRDDVDAIREEARAALAARGLTVHPTKTTVLERAAAMRFVRRDDTELFDMKTSFRERTGKRIFRRFEETPRLFRTLPSMLRRRGLEVLGEKLRDEPGHADEILRLIERVARPTEVVTALRGALDEPILDRFSVQQLEILHVLAKHAPNVPADVLATALRDMADATVPSPFRSIAKYIVSRHGTSRDLVRLASALSSEATDLEAAETLCACASDRAALEIAERALRGVDTPMVRRARRLAASGQVEASF